MFAELTRRLASKPGVSAMAILLSLVIAVLGLAPSIYASQVMGRYVSHARMATLVTISVGLAIAMIGEFAVRWVRHQLLESAFLAADEDLAEQVFSRLTEAERPMILGSFEVVTTTYSGYRAATVMDLPTGVIYLAALWWISSEIGLAATIAVILVVGMDLAMNRVSAVAGATKDGTRRRLTTAQQPTELKDRLVDWIDSGARLTRVSAAREGVMIIANNSAYCLVIAIGAILVVESNLPSSALFGAGLLTSRAVAIMLKLSGLLAEMKRALPAMETLVRLMRERQPLPIGNDAAPPQHVPSQQKVPAVPSGATMLTPSGTSTIRVRSPLPN
jgi:ATP-binding cassette subfamily C protein LapB